MTRCGGAGRGFAKRCAAVGAALWTAGAPTALLGQNGEGDGTTAAAGARAAPPAVTAHRIEGAPPVIDGIMDEADWATAMVARDFVVFEPDEGARPSQRTEARVLYGDDALYVGFRAFDSAPDSIETRLARRDERPHSDWVDVVVDSYLDRRTAFWFGVNPSGVKYDAYLFDDTNEDDSWDAVWDVATHRNDAGWSAEFRIPYSQLRFDGASEQTWGINFSRFVGRHLERSLWAPISRGDGALVSRFGDLEGLENLSPPKRLEVLPYSLVRMERAPGSLENPFHDPNDFSSTVGADLKYGITTDLTLDVTVNPDFGQVEADPAQVNLTAFESFFPERRPFFVEGASIFSFGFSEGDGDMASEGLFYSRRIGRAPRGKAPALYSETPDHTRILGALKLSGKTRSGWSVGVLHALTGREEALQANADGPLADHVVEPFAQYGMGRVARDFRDGKSAVGMISTWTRRDATAADDLDLHRSAFAGGVDGRHRFGDDRFNVSGYLLASTVRGSADAVARTQRSAARYFQRPDAEHTDYDPTRTSLNGWAGSATFSKVSGGFWRFAAGAMARSPGFDSNDLGFMREADFVAPFGWLGYNRYRSTDRFQRWNLNLNVWTPYSFGGEAFQKGANVNGSFTLKNFWGGYLGVARNFAGLSNTALRGGAMLQRDPSWRGWFGFWSDSRKALGVDVNNNWQRTPANDSWNYRSSVGLRWRPSPRATVSAGPFVNWRVEDLQWVRRIELDEPHYLFGRMDQTTAGITTRADWTFSPTLSLQLYAQPFVSAGDYDRFKRIVDSRAREYGDRFVALAAANEADDRLSADVDGDGTLESFRNPDFNVRQFRSNAVLRWEYRPGSTLFAVWSQGRDHRSPTGRFSFADDLGALWDEPGHDVFMLKVSHWIG